MYDQDASGMHQDYLNIMEWSSYFALNNGSVDLSIIIIAVVLILSLWLRYPDSALLLLFFMYLASDSKRTTKLILMKLFPHGRRSSFCLLALDTRMTIL